MIKVNDRFHMLKVLMRGDDYLNKNGKVAETTWLCKCDCGNEKVIMRSALQSGRTRSCGCMVKAAAKRRCKNGNSPRVRSGSYSSWAQMRSRCNDKNANGYEYYGGRGIKVCDRWSDFDLFMMDMGERPPGKSIDRIDTNGDYTPENCKWSTIREQSLNKRSNRIIVAFGIKMTMKEWSEFIGISYGALASRLNRGDSNERALREYNCKIHTYK